MTNDDEVENWSLSSFLLAVKDERFKNQFFLPSILQKNEQNDMPYSALVSKMGQI